MNGLGPAGVSLSLANNSLLILIKVRVTLGNVYFAVLPHQLLLADHGATDTFLGTLASQLIECIQVNADLASFRSGRR
jgi:hypothetical protein